ncbi:hypothetical protein DPMN_117975 [Dreissena polymorpha]|uniref:Uncharacterized protein n=1 Tax=Dreissena polymorpha TaxID=45954 RepID=A0A9D4GFW9_DREPO|nr:hypothetical protein DPMN_117975 [Dreissena polymorpha]
MNMTELSLYSWHIYVLSLGSTPQVANVSSLGVCSSKPKLVRHPFIEMKINMCLHAVT